MADADETPAQRQARIRREKREAKINGNAQERLDKITKLSGRTPESMRDASPAATQATATPASPSNRQSPLGAGGPPPSSDSMSPEQVKFQQEYLQALLRAAPPSTNGQEQGAQQSVGEDEDPMMKMLQSLMNGMGGDGDPNRTGGSPFSPEDLFQHTGLPSWVTSMLFGGQKNPPTPAEKKALKMWKIVHVVVAVVSGIYMLFTMNRAVRTFGPNPPAPATFQNPFLVFIMAQLILHSTRIFSAGQSRQRGPRLWYQMLKELAGDGAIIVVMLGGASWWKSYT